MQTGGGTYAEKKELSVMHLRARLWEWYRQERQDGVTHTQLQQLVPSFFGSAKKPTLDLHGSETNHFIRFVRVVFLEHGANMPQAALWRAGAESLNTILDVIHRAGYTNPSAGETQLYCDAAVAFINSCRALGLESRPKHHQMLELGARPSAYSVVYVSRPVVIVDARCCYCCYVCFLPFSVKQFFRVAFL